jgi:Abnormal spindle-like microcephaly-assoc'd, ASPM-SPD-2-Hydin/Protein of unknown function (DUF1573)
MRYGQARTIGTQRNIARYNRSAIFGLFVVASITLILSVVTGCAGLASGTKHTSSTTASFQLNPASVNFGQVAIGKQTTRTVSVTNTGSVAVNLVKLTVSDAHFTMTGMTTPMALAVGQSSNFTISVNPTAAGALTGTLTAQGDAGSTPVVVNLSATAVSSQAQLSLNQAALNFGNVPTGLKSTNHLVLTNTGAANLTISLLTLTGTDFSVSGITTPTTLTAGQSAQVAVTFSPPAAGSATGNLSIASNDPVNPAINVALSGTGTTAPTGQLNASANSVSFGSVATGARAEQQIMLTNAGNTGVTISSITVAGAGLTTSGIEVPGTLNPGEGAPLKVSFAPTGGTVTGSITVVSNAANSPLKIAVTGTAARVGLAISPSSFNFGSAVDGQTKSQTFTVTNTGTAALTIAKLSVSGSGYTVSGLTTPATIGAGGNTTFSVLFAPTIAGSLAGAVSLVSNAADSPNVLPLSGTGTAAPVTLSVSPASLSFANVNAGSSSSKAITISNTGTTSVTISQVSVSAKDVSVSGITTPLTLAAGQNASLNVAFHPNASENVIGNLTVASAQGANMVVAVTGNGVQPALSITPSTTSFGNVTVGSPASQTIQLQNTGTGTLSVSRLSVTGRGFSIGSLALPITLTSGQTSNFNVQFNPAAAGAVAGSVNISSNASNSTAAIPLSGTGVAATQALTFSTTSIAFGNVDAGSTAVQSVILTNSGNSNVTISKITESGAGFGLTGAGTPITLNAGQIMSFNVIFNPNAAGSDVGTITVTSTAASSAKSIMLSGTGVQLSHSVTLMWTASTSTVAGYNIYRTTVSGSGYVRINSGLIPGLTYTDTTVQPGITYYYVVTAVDASGNESTDSNQATAIIP